ncbi:MAG: helix-turn-helix domain-containing protein [Ardenticatenaceae bacterium]|nr:helix-turn-helix domain-containing protein [Ardenticatenaceae bacterium]
MNEQTTQPTAEMVISDVETMKVVADALRLQILDAMRQPTTVKAVAAQLETPPAKLYYHVNLLEKHGLIQVVGINIETGIVEKQYQVTAHRFLMRNPVLAGAELSAENVSTLVASMLDDSKDGFRRAYAQRDPNEPAPPRHPFASKKAFKLTEAQITAFHAKLVALIEETDRLAAENADLPTEPFELTAVFYQRQVKE